MFLFSGRFSAGGSVHRPSRRGKSGGASWCPLEPTPGGRHEPPRSSGTPSFESLAFCWLAKPPPGSAHTTRTPTRVGFIQRSRAKPPPAALSWSTSPTLIACPCPAKIAEPQALHARDNLHSPRRPAAWTHSKARALQRRRSQSALAHRTSDRGLFQSPRLKRGPNSLTSRITC